jgi:prepilin-type N-terminal cleavage/methylation domain-containing protein
MYGMLARTRDRKGQGGFSAIEVLVALVVVAALIKLTVSIIGPIQQKAGTTSAATKIADDMNNLYQAACYYTADNGVLLTNNGTTWQTQLLQSAVLSSIPKPTMGQDTSYVGTFGYALDSATYSGFGDPTKTDTVLVLAGVDATVCKQINEKYSSMLDPSIIPNGPTFTLDIQCYNNGGTYTAIRPINFDMTKTN